MSDDEPRVRRVQEDELWPMYAVEPDDSYGPYRIELTDAELADYERVEAEWRRWQARLRDGIRFDPDEPVGSDA